MKYKYQVVSHESYYPSSILFQTLEEAQRYYNSIKSVNYDNSTLITLCEIIDFKGEEPESPEIDWYLQFKAKEETN